MRLHYRVVWLIALAFARVAWGYRRRGTDLIPATGPVIVACNHISNWDPILVGLGCRREMHFMAKEELFRNPLLAWLIRTYGALPVRRGVMDRGALRAASEILSRGEALIMFPGGTRDQSGEVRDPKSGVGYLACMNEADVVPAYITGANRLSGAFRRAVRLRVAFAEPMRAEKAESSDEYRAFTQRVADEIGRLRLEVEGG